MSAARHSKHLATRFFLSLLLASRLLIHNVRYRPFGSPKAWRTEAQSYDSLTVSAASPIETFSSTNSRSRVSAQGLREIEHRSASPSTSPPTSRPTPRKRIRRRGPSPSGSEFSNDDQSFRARGRLEHVLSPEQTLRESPCPFSNTTTWRSLFDSNNAAVPVDIDANFTKAYAEDTTADRPHHIMYRRNYFAVSVSYRLRPPPGSVDNKLYVRELHLRYPIEALLVKMRGVKNNEQGDDVHISVFTAKRGPPIFPPPPLEQKMQPKVDIEPRGFPGTSGYGRTVLEGPKQHTFSRLQFRKATDNNGDRRRRQSFFRVVVELVALIERPAGNKERIKIASAISGRLLVRGRCPNSFKQQRSPTIRKRQPRKATLGRPKGKDAKSRSVTKATQSPKKENKHL